MLPGYGEAQSNSFVFFQSFLALLISSEMNLTMPSLTLLFTLREFYFSAIGFYVCTCCIIQSYDQKASVVLSL